MARISVGFALLTFLSAGALLVLAVMGEATQTNWSPVLPADLFRTNAWMLGHITSEKDAGVIAVTR